MYCDSLYSNVSAVFGSLPIQFSQASRQAFLLLEKVILEERARSQKESDFLRFLLHYCITKKCAAIRTATRSLHIPLGLIAQCMSVCKNTFGINEGRGLLHM